jgi:hypothetical protein
VTLGKDALHDLLQSSFAIMVVLVPLSSFVAPRFPCRFVPPAIYVFSLWISSALLGCADNS